MAAPSVGPPGPNPNGMIPADWPVQAAKELGLCNYLDLFPADYAWRLKRREKGLGFTSSF